MNNHEGQPSTTDVYLRPGEEITGEHRGTIHTAAWEPGAGSRGSGGQVERAAELDYAASRGYGLDGLDGRDYGHGLNGGRGRR